MISLCSTAQGGKKYIETKQINEEKGKEIQKERKENKNE
jgi:hypothetical protein